MGNSAGQREEKKLEWIATGVYCLSDSGEFSSQIQD